MRFQIFILGLSFCLFQCKNKEAKEVLVPEQANEFVLVYQFAGDYFFGPDTEKQITILDSHAPEIFQDEDGQWYVSSVEWPNRGVSVDKLNWE